MSSLQFSHSKYLALISECHLIKILNVIFPLEFQELPQEEWEAEQALF